MNGGAEQAFMLPIEKLGKNCLISTSKMREALSVRGRLVFNLPYE